MIDDVRAIKILEIFLALATRLQIFSAHWSTKRSTKIKCTRSSSGCVFLFGKPKLDTRMCIWMFPCTESCIIVEISRMSHECKFCSDRVCVCAKTLLFFTLNAPRQIILFFRLFVNPLDAATFARIVFIFSLLFVKKNNIAKLCFCHLMKCTNCKIRL